MKYLITMVTAAYCIVNFAYADTATKHFQYSVRIPATENSCDAEAGLLAQKVNASQSGLVNVSGRCIVSSTLKDHNESFVLYTLLVDYDSVNPLRSYRATIFSDENFGESALYPSYRSCLNELSTQAKIFAQATALAPLVAYCEPVRPADYGYQLKTEGIGEPIARLYQFKDASKLSINDQNWSKQIQDVLAKAGATLARQYENTYLYYAKNTVSITSNAIVTLDSLDHCQVQKDEVVSLYKQMGAKNVFTTCYAEREYQGITLDVIADTTNYVYSDYGVHSGQYFSFEECMANRDVIKQNAIANGISPFGAFCVPDISNQGQYSVNIFTY